MIIDVLVVGGGPVGLVTALHAHAAGLQVEVLEPRPTPIDASASRFQCTSISSVHGTPR